MSGTSTSRTDRASDRGTPFGRVFYAAISSAGMSANQFAKAVRTSSGYLSGIYSGGRTPPLRRISRWADLLNLAGRRKRCFIVLAHLMHCTPQVRGYVLRQLGPDPMRNPDNDPLLQEILDNR